MFQRNTFWRDHKKAIVGASLAFISALTIVIVSYFLNTRANSHPVTINNNIADSSPKTTNSLIQKNENKGDVNNDNINRDKNVTNNYYPPQSDKPNGYRPDKIHDTSVINNGIINNGGINNTYNQNINTQDQRHVIDSDLQKVILQVPKRICIWVLVPLSDNESSNFGKELINKLRELGYDANGFGNHITSDMPQRRFDIYDERKSNKSPCFNIYVYPNVENL